MIRILLGILLVMGIPQRCSGEPDITVADCKESLSYLASDELEGRGSGSEGNRKAAAFISEKFKSYGLETRLQPFHYSQVIRFWLFGRHRMSIETSNVIGILKGSTDRHIVIGAHFDHLGISRGIIYNGADDNASGTTGLLELAEALAAPKIIRDYTIVFIAFSGEELGLLGSQHYVRNPVFPLNKCDLMINLDMVGRLRGTILTAQGGNLSRSQKALVRQLDDDYPFTVRITAAGNRSDHAPFNWRGVPVLFFHTGTHPQYHQPSNDEHLINYKGLVQISKFTLDLTRKMIE